MKRAVDSAKRWWHRKFQVPEGELSTKVIPPTTTSVVLKAVHPTPPSLKSLPPQEVSTGVVKVLRRLLEMELALDKPGPIREMLIRDMLEKTGKEER